MTTRIDNPFYIPYINAFRKGFSLKHANIEKVFLSPSASCLWIVLDDYNTEAALECMSKLRKISPFTCIEVMPFIVESGCYDLDGLPEDLIELEVNYG